VRVITTPAPQRLRRLAECADKGAPHPIRVAKPGELRDAIDRLTGGLHPLARATFTSPGRPPVHVRLASCHVPANKALALQLL
jgi:hypothetical protein